MKYPINRQKLIVCIFALLTPLVNSAWADLTADVHALQERWAEVNYQMQGKAQLSAFEALIKEADQVVVKYRESADGWIWSGIIKSTYAGAKGGLGALSYAKASKKDLEKALSIDPDALSGSAYTSLGTLYFNVPGWPIGFGDDEKAEQLLKKALTVNPIGIDSNYFYGYYLIHEKRYQEAKNYLLKAKGAPARPDRPLADAGRQKEIDERLSLVEAKLKK